MFQAAQEFMQSRGIDAWLVHDFRSSNSVLAALVPGKRFLTRRVELLIPAKGDATLLAHHIDAAQFATCGVRVEKYLTWQEYRAWILATGLGRTRVAMEYAPGATLPVVGVVDAGTVELVRSAGVEVVSSADLIQVSVAKWSAEALAKHKVASAKVNAIKDDAFGFIKSSLAGGTPVNEYQVQQRMLEAFAREGLETPDGPIVAANAHAGDPHFEVSHTSPAAIRKGDWILIDLWARVPGDENIFSDITWVGYCGSDVPPRHRAVYEAVTGARDAALACVQHAWAKKQPVQGWQVDEASQVVLRGSGFGEFIRHRTGHSLSPGPKVHGVGVNIDNTETHDTREVLPGVGFTIEPGLYLPEFGVRSEINVFMDPVQGPVVTSEIQRDVLRLA
ncbi:MAG: M24 family metallopeptidase [Phycisphaerales bacterium]|jgi:Xaa-Pro aminopeptidase